MLSPPLPHEIRAVLLDVDGTLYRQRPLRMQMMRALMLLPLRAGLGKTRRTLRAIRAFRSVLEQLRELPPGSGLAAQHFERAASLASMPEEELRRIIQDWMTERPLPRLAALRRPGLREFLSAQQRLDRPLGVLSDYATDAKLKALGVDDLITLQLCCTDPEIDAMKPHPHGFLRAAELWGIPAQNILYVGDRVSVDAGGATAAGMMCAIVGVESDGARFLGFRDFHDLGTKLG